MKRTTQLLRLLIKRKKNLVKKVNGIEVDNLKHLSQVIEECSTGYLRLDLENEKVLILNNKLARKANSTILKELKIPSAMSDDLQPRQLNRSRLKERFAGLVLFFITGLLPVLRLPMVRASVSRKWWFLQRCLRRLSSPGRDDSATSSSPALHRGFPRFCSIIDSRAPLLNRFSSAQSILLFNF
ncbi:hypothetical protein F2Q70_00027904 [Brassica cretica]|uniref:Protease Do-like PDZ domain-containing protein n=1 Tax=Brassica cretica TaxID=69181 RepID=A0A8S9L9K6_BRACR|nr:hypothetical protein F2Q70_00027904 [Brassica cretica]